MEKERKITNVLLGILIVILLILGGLFVYKEFIDKDKEETNTTQSDNTNTNTSENAACEECKNYIKSSSCIYDDKSMEEKIVLGSKVRNLKFECVGYDGVIGSGPDEKRILKIDNQVVNEVVASQPSGYSDTQVYVVDNELLVVVNKDGIYFYDKNLKQIEYDFDSKLNSVEPGMYLTTFWENTSSMNNSIDKNVYIKGNKIVFYATREPELLGSDGTIKYENNQKIKVVDYDKNCYIDEYKDIVVEAKFEIEYLGNNNLSNPKMTSVLSNVSNNYGKLISGSCSDK